jgi:hypothetical protein
MTYHSNIYALDLRSETKPHADCDNDKECPQVRHASGATYHMMPCILSLLCGVSSTLGVETVVEPLNQHSACA